MDPVLDFPVPAAPRQHLTRPGHVRTQRSDAVYRFCRGLAGLEHGSFAHDAKGLAAARQRHEALVVVARSKHIAHPLLQPTVALVDGLATARAIPLKRLQVLQHGGLVALDHQDVIGLPGNDQCCGFPATVQGVQGQPPPRHIHFLDQLASSDGLAADEAAGGHLAADDTGAVLHSGNQATIRLARCAVRRLAVEGQSQSSPPVCATQSRTARSSTSGSGSRIRQDAVQRGSRRRIPLSTGRTKEGSHRPQLLLIQARSKLADSGHPAIPRQLGYHRDRQHAGQRMPDAPRRTALRRLAQMAEQTAQARLARRLANRLPNPRLADRPDTATQPAYCRSAGTLKSTSARRAPPNRPPSARSPASLPTPASSTPGSRRPQSATGRRRSPPATPDGCTVKP